MPQSSSKSQTPLQFVSQDSQIHGSPVLQPLGQDSPQSHTASQSKSHDAQSPVVIGIVVVVVDIVVVVVVGAVVVVVGGTVVVVVVASGTPSKDSGLLASYMCSNMNTELQFRAALYMQVVKCWRVRMSLSIDFESSILKKIFDVAPTLTGNGTFGIASVAAVAGEGVKTPAANVKMLTAKKEGNRMRTFIFKPLQWLLEALRDQCPDNSGAGTSGAVAECGDTIIGDAQERRTRQVVTGKVRLFHDVSRLSNHHRK